MSLSCQPVDRFLLEPKLIDTNEAECFIVFYTCLRVNKTFFFGGIE